jgi:hypothetical protein
MTKGYVYVRRHIPVAQGLLVDGAQLKRQTLHDPCSPRKSTYIFSTDTTPGVPVYCNNYVELYK